MFKKQGLIYLLFITGLFSGCATMTPEMVQKKHAEWQAEVDRFERAQGLSCFQVPELYDTSRLKVGSTVNIKSIYGKSKYSTTKILYDIKPVENGKKYIINEIMGNYMSTLEGDPLAFSKVICTDDTKYTNFPMPGVDNVPTAVIKGALSAGPVGVAMNLIDRPSTQRVYNQVEQDLKEHHKVETKILDFKLVSQEKLTIANQAVSCRVYQIQTITRVTYSSNMGFVMEESLKVWISDDVPFGFVKSEGSQISYQGTLHCKYREKTGETILTSKQDSIVKNEVAEFKY
ncbi:MAG: hypothetical protein PHQ96_03165 [Candidatus Omnitrophica bacterium]|nr:hypothetical protein [Candidatus Omnitrophota bacterium]